MKLIVGLGNPGDSYQRTRHNAGFWVVDELARRLGTKCDRLKWQAHVAECRFGAERVVLCKPQTFMNRSGESVAEVVRCFRLDPQQALWLIYDDMDFPPGVVKLREKGRAGGHNGVRSVIEAVGTDQFPRVRLGVGRPLPGSDVVHYVLSPFPPEQREVVEQMVQTAADAVLYALEHSFARAMNRFNEVNGRHRRPAAGEDAAGQRTGIPDAPDGGAG
ncbi:MAG: aminoacyl-tRNA hydrolase [Alicyclobacillaceae bacterium]|nr:aminoacyl-tRNA hydrolase [Alicyclobacillaceae bacterium]